MDELSEGWHYVRGSLPIRSILMNLALVSVFGMSYSVLMPIFAAEVLHGGPNTLGLLMSAVGIGALVGDASLTMRRSIVGLARRIVDSDRDLRRGADRVRAVACRCGSRWLILPVLGFGLMQQMAPSNTILQTIVDDEKRGRVMSFYAMSFLGMVPFGSLLAGAWRHASVLRLP